MNRIYEATPIILTEAERTELEGLVRSTKTEHRLRQRAQIAQAWRIVLDDLIKRGLRKPEFLIVDGSSGLERALTELWSDVPTQRCTVHKHRNLLAHALKRTFTVRDKRSLAATARGGFGGLQRHDLCGVGG